MKIFNPAFLSLTFFLIIFASLNKANAASTTTTTAGAAPTSTSGMYQPEPPKRNVMQQGQQTGAVSGSNRPSETTECVDAGGVLGARCGVKAIQFCKQNPEAPDCKKIIKDNNLSQ